MVPHLISPLSRFIRHFFAVCAARHIPVWRDGLWCAAGNCRDWNCAMRKWWGSSNIVFQVSVAIIVVELVLLIIGLDLTLAGVEPAVFGAP